MIRFEKKPDPQPAPKEVEDLEQTREPAADGDKKPATAAARRRPRQGADDDRLI